MSTRTTPRSPRRRSRAPSGDYNVALGYGTEGLAGESATIRIGGMGYQTKTFIEGIRGATVAPKFGLEMFDEAVCTSSSNQLGPCAESSLRFKEGVEAMGDTAALVSTLRPVRFRYIPKEGQSADQPLQYGLIAEEVAKIFPTLVSRDDEGKPYTVRYSLLTPLLLNELQRLEEEMAAQEGELEALSGVEGQVAELRKQMVERDRQLADLSRRLEKLAKKKRFRSE